MIRVLDARHWIPTEQPEAMRSALVRHDEILRTAIESHAGYVVKTMGDGFHAAFSAAHDALNASIAAQRAIDTEPWSATGPLRVRVGARLARRDPRVRIARANLIRSTATSTARREAWLRVG